MIILRRNTERRHIRYGGGDMWRTFFQSEDSDTSINGFGCIALLNEYLLPSNESMLMEAVHDTESLTYVHIGALALEGPERNFGLITAGEFQGKSIVNEQRQRITNTFYSNPAHLYRLCLRMPPLQSGANRINGHKRFTIAQRHNVLFSVAAPDAKKESLSLTSDAYVYSSILDPGHHVVHELLQGRKVWLHIIYGKVTVNKVDLAEGDGIGISDDSSISLTAMENTELLLVDTIDDYNNPHSEAVVKKAVKRLTSGRMCD